MRSKLSSLSLCLGVIVLLAQCSYFFDRKEKPREISYQLETGSCLRNGNRVLSHYWDANQENLIANSDFDYLRDCYASAIEAIVLYTRSGGSERNNYTAENIHRLLLRLYPDVTVSQEQIAHFILLKHFLIGGETASISKREMEFLKARALPVFTDTLKLWNPDRVLLLRGLWLTRAPADFARNEESYRQVGEVFDRLDSGLEQLLSVLEVPGENRDIELEQILQVIEPGAQAGQGLQLYLPLLQAFKNLALNQQGGRLRRSDLAPLVRQSALVYKIMSRFRYFMLDQGIFDNVATLVTYPTRVPTLLKDSSVFKGVAVRGLHDIYELASEFFLQASDRVANRQVEFDLIADVLTQLESSRLVKDSFNSDALNLFMRRFIRNWMPDSDGQKTVINSQRVQYLKEVIQTWIRRQQLVNTIFTRQGQAVVNLHEISGEFVNQPDFADWRRIFSKVSLHQWDDQHRVVMYSASVDQLSYEDFTVSNSQWLLVDLFTKRYNRDKGHVFDYVVTSEQAQEIYELLRVLGVQMGFMDSREFNSGRRSFRESNNFSTQRANDEAMDFFESYEYLSVAFSAGPLSDAIHAAMSESCYLDYRDVLGKPVIKTECFRRFIRQNFDRFFSHLSTVNDFWRRANDNEKESFIHTLEIASRGGVISEKPVDMGEIRVMVSVVYYLQSIYYNFDLDRNGTIEGIELRNAERHYHDLIVELILGHPQLEELIDQVNRAGWWFVSVNWDTNLSNEEMARLIAPKVFIFLLERGRLPVSLSDKLRFGNLLNQDTENAAYLSTRASLQQVLTVFSAIAEISHSGHLANIVRFLESHQPELMQEISQPQVPQCLDGTRRSRFCEWARVIFCNETINNHLFEWMRENRFAIFQDQLWRRDPQESIRHTMAQFSLIFRSHVRFSTQCGFPQVATED